MDLTEAVLLRRRTRGEYFEVSVTPRRNRAVRLFVQWPQMIERCPLCRAAITSTTRFTGPSPRQKARTAAMLQHLVEEH